MADATTPDDNSGTPSGYKTSEDVARWLSLIERAQNDAQEYQRKCDKIRDLYRYKGSKAIKRRKYALLYSNIETLRPAVYGRAPKPVVDSRFKSGDPVSLTAGQMLERALTFQFDVCKYHDTFEKVTQDYLLYGRGVPRLRYEPVVQEAAIEDGLDEAAVEGPQLEAKQESEDVEPDEIVAFEHVFCDFVQRDDFIHPPARSWNELPWLVYRAFLSREELVKRFGEEIGRKIPLDAKPTDNRDRNQSRTDSVEDKATIYEVWDKTKRWVCWIAKGYPEILEESDPYLKLNGFYPSPKPAYGIMTNDSLEPVPDYIEYQDQAEEIDDLTARIASLQDSLKLVGFYPGGPEGEGAPEIERAVKPGFENRMVAVKSWTVFTEGGKGGAPIIWLPVEQVLKVLEGCVQIRKELIDDVYQITGISDIQRGDTDPDETAAAQQMKNANGGKRIQTRQKEIARLCAEVTQMAGEIISEVFDINTLMKMSDMKLPSDQDVQKAQMDYEEAVLKSKALAQLQQAAPQPQGQPPQGMPPGAAPQPGGPPQGQPAPQIPPPPPPPPDPGPTQEQVMALLRDNVTRRFRLDIETDSTIGMDEAGEQTRRTAFITEITQFVVGWAPIIQQQPELAQLAGTLLKFGVRAFPAAREIESEIDKTIDQLVQGASQPKAPPPLDPADQAKIQVANMTMQGKLAQIKQQGDNDMLRHQGEMQQLQVKGQIEQTKAQVELENARMEGMQSAQAHQQSMERANFDMQAAREVHMQRMIKPEASSQPRDVASNPVGGPVTHPSAGGNPPIHPPSVTVVVPPPSPVHNAAIPHQEMAR